MSADDEKFAETLVEMYVLLQAELAKAETEAGRKVAREYALRKAIEALRALEDAS